MKWLFKKTVIAIFVISCIALFQSCKKTSLPEVTTSNVSDITSSSAVSGGNVTNNGGADVSARGVCWATSQNPTISSSKTSDGSGNGSFTSSITGLSANTSYYVRAYATNSQGTAYGNEVTFSTGCPSPTATTEVATNLTSTSATLNGTVNPNGSSTTVTFEYGTTTSYGSTVNASQSPVSGNSNTSVSAGITGLTPGTVYHFRVKAVSCGGTVYGNDLAINSPCTAPTATTNTATNVTTSSATLNGTVNANGSSTTVTFEYGTTTSYGSTVNASPGTVTGTGNTSVSAGITGLNPGTTYHYRVKAVNCGGTIYGSDQTINSSCSAPTATTNAATNLTGTTVTLNGTVNANGSSTTVTFDWGTTTSYGSSVTASQSPVTGTSNATVSAGLTSLTSGTLYHFRVKAVSCGGTIYGSDQTFTPPCSAPTATTNAATNIASTSATLNGLVNASGSSTTVTFDYGLTTSYGSSVTASPSPVSGSSNTSVTAGISGLTPGSTYHFRVKAVSCGGTIYGSDQQFVAPAGAKNALYHVGINRTNINLASSTVVGQITINPSVSGKVIVTFDGNCISSPGDRIVLAASNTTSWGTNDGSVGVEVYNTDMNGNPFSHTRVYDVTAGSHTYYAIAHNYVELDGDGIASIYGSLTVHFIPASTTSLVGFAGIYSPSINLASPTTVGSVTINPTVAGKAIVRFDGYCIASPGDKIVLAASNTTNWGVNDGNVDIEVVDSDVDKESFAHTRVYDVTAGSRTFYAVAQNYVETDGSGIATICGSLTVLFIPSTSVVAFTGIERTFVNLSSNTVLAQLTINPSVSGKVLVRFDGNCISSPGDKIVLAASNTTTWGTNDGNVDVEAINSDLDGNVFSHTRVYSVTAGSRTFYAVGQRYVETAGTGIASIYGSLIVEFFPD